MSPGDKRKSQKSTKPNVLSKGDFESVVVLLTTLGGKGKTMTNTFRKETAEVLRAAFHSYEAIKDFERALKLAFARGFLNEEEYHDYEKLRCAEEEPHKYQERCNLRAKVNYHWRPIIDMAFDKVKLSNCVESIYKLIILHIFPLAFYECIRSHAQAPRHT
jgi:DNA-binding MltR family transcriptional regulator